MKTDNEISLDKFVSNFIDSLRQECTTEIIRNINDFTPDVTQARQDTITNLEQNLKYDIFNNNYIEKKAINQISEQFKLHLAECAGIMYSQINEKAQFLQDNPDIFKDIIKDFMLSRPDENFQDGDLKKFNQLSDQEKKDFAQDKAENVYKNLNQEELPTMAVKYASLIIKNSFDLGLSLNQHL